MPTETDSGSLRRKVSNEHVVATENEIICMGQPCTEEDIFYTIDFVVSWQLFTLGPITERF